MFRLLSKFTWKEWLFVVIAVGFIVFGVWMDMTLPDHIYEITSLVTVPGGTIGEVWMEGVWMLVLALGSALTAVVVGYIAAIISSSHSARVRKEIFEKVGRLSAAEMKSFSTASLITRSTNDITQVRMFIVMGMQLLIKAPITAVWAISEILGKSWELSMVTLVAVVALIIVLTVVIILVLPKFKIIQRLTDNLNKVSRENLKGLRVVRAYNAENFEGAKFEKANDEVTRVNMTVNRAMGLFWPFIAILLSGLSVAIYWVGASLINNSGGERITLYGDILVFSQYAVQVIFSFMMLVLVFVMLPRTTVSARRINEVIEKRPSVTSGKGAEVDPAKVGEVSMTNVAFKYPDAAGYILKDINLDIKKGQTVAFIGSTGSGKSTLVNLVSRIYDVTEGELTVAGVNVRDFKLEQLNDRVGYIPQSAVLFQGTVRSNIAFGTARGAELSDEEIWHALKIAQARDFVERLPDKLDAPVSQNGKNFSGGQKQRLAIARVLARRPEIIIFDDTFSALDYKTDKALRTALRKETKDATVLIVAQRIGTIKDADMIVVLENGLMVGKGTHKELMKTCEIYKEIALSQLSKEELA